MATFDPPRPGSRLIKTEIEDRFDTNFGYQISGINVRTDENEKRYILLFASEMGPYDDSVGDKRFEYVGEGLEGDQKENSPGNAALLEAVDRPTPIYFFYKSTDGAEWEYQGRVDVDDYEYVERDGRKVFVFTMEHVQGTDPTPIEINSEKRRIEDSVSSQPSLTDNSEYEITRRKARDRAFSDLVTEAYDGKCAVCGKRRESPTGNTETEAAHIYPKREGGSDDVRNGIALCRLHHWAFDAGWLIFTDEHLIEVADAPNRDGYHEFKQLEGRKLHLPDNDEYHPHPLFLENRQKLGCT